MSSDRNKDTVRRIYEALETGDGSVFARSVHPHYVWRVAGQASWSGTFEGHEAIRDKLLRPLYSRFAGTYTARATNIIGEGDWVVAEVRGDVELKGSGRYDNSYCFLFRFEDGLIAEVVEYGDTDLEERVLGPYDAALRAVEAG